MDSGDRKSSKSSQQVCNGDDDAVDAEQSQPRGLGTGGTHVSQ